MFEVVNAILKDDADIISIVGSKGIGKTRLINECRFYLRLNNQGLIGNVNYLDFTNVTSFNGIRELFTQNHLDYMLTSQIRLSKISSSHRSRKNVIICDNIESICKDLGYYFFRQILKDDQSVVLVLLSY